MSAPIERRPFADAAKLYRDAGWMGTIPLGGRRAGHRKSPPPPRFTGWAGVDPSGADVAAWVDGHEAGQNIALHVPAGVYVIDVDGGNLAELEAKCGPLPATWSSTARGAKSTRRQMWFRAELPAGRMWRDHPAPGVDSVHVGHRYAMVWPSINPDADGATVHWYDRDGELYEGVPEPAWLADLPAAWIDACSQDGSPLDGGAAPVDDALDVIRRFRRGDACPAVHKAVTVELDRLARADDGTEGLHKPGPLLNLVGYGIEGHRGVAEALSVHQDAYREARVRLRGARPGEVDAEWWRMVCGAVGKKLAQTGGAIDLDCWCDLPPAYDMTDDLAQSAPVDTSDVVDPSQWGSACGQGSATDAPALTLPESFWAARPVLGQIRQAAHARGNPADAVLFATLARLSATVSHQLRLDAGLGEGSLNLFVALVAGSGGGKSSSMATAARLLATPDDLARAGAFHDGLPIGSGEGLIESFYGHVEEPTGEVKATGPNKGEPKTKLVRRQVRHNVFVSIDEGEVLNKIADRSGATIWGVVRAAWTGALVGQANASTERTRILPAGSYALGIVAAFQREIVQRLFDGTDAGTPQRFLWCTVHDPLFPDEPPAYPDVLLTSAGVGPFGDLLTGVVTFAPEIRAGLRRERGARIRRETDVPTLDQHRALMMCKVSALLALLDGRMDVNADDWALAAALWRVSCAVRDSMLAYGAEQEERRQAARTAAYVEREERAQLARTGATERVERIARRVAMRVRQGAASLSVARKVLAAKERHLWDDALAFALARDWVRQDGRALVPGGSEPSEP